MSNLVPSPLISAVAARQPLQVLLSDDRYADAMCFSLQRIGAEVQLHRDL